MYKKINLMHQTFCLCSFEKNFENRKNLDIYQEFRKTIYRKYDKIIKI